ncbi:Outer membrane receptor proteins, mostly Fe transport [Prevotellaceae bacterium HUN156]|nr:Outer membrane receptor proteins, mostly Fe transport [Prevotellaceae bacterium HUN156]
MMALVAVSIATSAWADSRLAPADSSRVYDLDEVVVVSQSKEYAKLRQQPLSLTVLTGNEIGSLGVRDLREISDFVPSFVMPNYGARFTSSIYVRGIGSRVNSPSMGIYVDDIPLMNKSAFNSHTWQLDRVDVLRGPQGTLYGVNTEGGLVRQYTKNPLRYQGTDIKLGIGTHFYRNAEVAHYQKLSEKLAMSVAAFYDGTNGFWKNTLNGERADDMDEAGGRLRLIYQPTDRLSFDWTTDYQWVKQKAYPYGVLDPVSGDVIGEPNQNHQSNYKRNMLTTGLAIKYKGNGFDFASNTSYQFLKDNLLMDNDYSNVDFITVDQAQLSNALTQEFTVKSNNKSRWHWTTGVFGSYSWLKTTAPNQFGTFFPQMLEQQIYGAMLKSMMGRGMSQEQANAAITARGGINISMAMDIPCLFHTPQFNLGVFHESHIDLTDNLTATIGLRYDFTQAKIEFDTRGISMNPVFSIMGQTISPTRIYTDYIGSDKANFSQLLPKFGLTYKFDNGSNIYATVSKGYRAGGFNVQMFGDIIQSDLQKAIQMLQGGKPLPEIVLEHRDEACAPIMEGISFKPEESWNYEVGTHLNLFDNLIHFDLSTFYMQIRNQQLSVFTSDYGFGRRMVNAGKSYSCGIEATLRGSALANHLAWSVGYGYTHAAFKEYTTKASSAATAAEIDYSDNKVPFVPAHTLSALVDYRFDFEDAWMKNLTIGANMNAQGKIWWDEANTYAQKFYAVFGAHASVDFGGCTLNLWARNLTDAQYNTFAFSSKATGKEIYMAQRGNPFQLGADLSIHF